MYETDNPGGLWLKQARTKAMAKKQQGYVFLGERTATFTGTVSTALVDSLPGQCGEQVSEQHAQDLAADMRAGGYTGTPVFLVVDVDGAACISEGNHRVRAAVLAGLDSIPVEIGYFDGGEQQAGSLHPELFN